MAGIIEAEHLINNHRSSGEVVKKGITTDTQGVTATYIIIFLDDDTEIIQYDYSSDLKISDNIDLGDRCKLVLKDEYTAEWVKE